MNYNGAQLKCDVCPRNCSIQPDMTGFCNARMNQNNKIIDKNYGIVTAIALDPIEKKPLRNYKPGSNILSVGSYGCNLDCGFCQNNRIARATHEDVDAVFMSPENLAQKALSLKSQHNIGLAYTYNEPLIGFEFVYDCSKAIKALNMDNVVVTNGYVSENYLTKLLPYIDAMNIDLKSYNEDFYKKFGGDLETVKNSIRVASKKCHVEVTSLIIPGENDRIEEMEQLSKWLSEIGDIPLHISRFYPCYKYSSKSPTPVETIENLVSIASKNLSNVYKGNC